MKRKICIVTSTRAEYGLLSGLLHSIALDPDLEYQLIVTGSHLSQAFGLTVSEIMNDGFIISEKLEILGETDSKIATAQAAGIAVSKFAESFEKLRPDLILILGDRYEILSAAFAASILSVPIAHIHGGESTVGAFDEVFRHAITKMSHIHFVAAQEYANRVIQMGENPKNVYVTGGLGVDAISKVSLLSRIELEQKLGFEFKQKNLLITYHPVTLDFSAAKQQFRELLSALSELQDTQLIFTYPNSDPESRDIIFEIELFVEQNENAVAFKSLGKINYYSCISHVDGVVGNSSSGLLEVPSFKRGTINIGNRQNGRLKSASVIDCIPTKYSILNALNELYSKIFQDNLEFATNPYGTGGAINKIVEILNDITLEGIVIKEFYDLESEDK